MRVNHQHETNNLASNSGLFGCALSAQNCAPISPEKNAKLQDAVLHDTPNILYFIKTAGNGQFKAVGDSLEAQQYGIAFPKGSDELRDKVNGALKTLRENGTYNEIYKKWFGTEPK